MHESRTRQLWDTTCAMLARDYPKCTVTLLGGFDPVDEIPVKRVCERDDYQSCHDKTWAALNGNTGEEADWFIIADDDTWFNLPNLARMIEALPQEQAVICGAIEPTRLQDQSQILHAHGGCGILISAAALQSLLAVAQPWPRHDMHSDVSLAMLAKQASVCWCHLEDMIGPHDAFDMDALNTAVSVHVKDRISFYELYAALTEKD